MSQSQELQSQEIDLEIQELVKQILENQNENVSPEKLNENVSPENRNENVSPEKGTTTARTPTVNIIKLCLCTDPQCSARKGVRTTETPPEEGPQITYVQANNKSEKKTIQIQFDEYVPISWENQAAFIECHSNSIHIKSLIDTGSVISIISETKANQISAQPEWKEAGGLWDRTVNIKAYSCTNNQLDLKGRISIPNFRIQNNQPLPINTSFWVLKDASEEAIISGEWLSIMKATLSMPHKLIYYSIPKSDLSAGGEQYVVKEANIHTYPDTTETMMIQNEEEIQEDQEQAATTQQVRETLQKRKPCIPAQQHYSITMGPSHKIKMAYTTMLIDQLPAKLRVHQNKVILHIANTTYRAQNLTEEAEIRQSIPEHARIDITEDARLDTHIKEMDQRMNEMEPSATGRKTTLKDNRSGIESQMKQGLEKMQAKFDFKEHMNPSLLPIKTNKEDKIILTGYTSLGPMPFNKNTDKLTMLLCYILLSIGNSLDLQNLSTNQLHITLQEFQEKKIQAIKNTIDKTYQNHNITKIYQELPVKICHHLHLDLSMAFDNIARIQKSQLPTRHKKTTIKAIYSRLMIRTQALSVLMYYTQSLIGDLAATYGQHPYFHHEIVSSPQFLETTEEIDQLPKKLLHQIMRSNQQVRQTQPKVQMNRIKSQTEFEEFILPTTTPYQDREYTFNEFKTETITAYEKLNRDAELQMRPPSNNIHKKLTIDQLRTPKEVDEYVQYATSPSALFNFMKEQLPPSTDDVIPLGEFLESLHQAKLVIYDTPEQAIQDYIPPQLRPQFNQFFQMFQDRQFIETSKQLRLPDYPQMHVWGTPEEPSPLHDINTGLVAPEWLAFCATQMLDTKDILLEKDFETELALLASIIFVYGNFCLSLHQSHIGLFREDVFRAKAILCPHTALQNAKIPKGIGEIDCPDLNDKIDFMLKHGKAVRMNASPFLTSMTSISKKRKISKPLQFEDDSPILQHLLSLSQPQREQIANRSKGIMQARQKLATHVTTNPRSLRVKITNQKNHNKHEWTRTFPIVQITEKSLRNRGQENKFTPPIHHHDKKHILHRLNDLNKITKPRPEKNFRWGSIITVEFEIVKDESVSTLSTHLPQYYRTPEDYQIHRMLNTNQQVATGSKHIVSPENRQYRQKIKETGYTVRYALPNLPVSGSKNLPYDPTTTRNQGMLSNAHALNKLIEETSTMAWEARIGPEDPRYEEIIRITVQQVNKKENLAKTKTLMTSARTSKRNKRHLKATINTIGHHATSIRNTEYNCQRETTDDNWQQCQKALSLTLGTALIHSSEEADRLASIGPNLNKFIRARQHLQPYKLKAKKQQMAQDLVQGIWPERKDDWGSIKLNEAIKHFGSWENLFTAMTRFYQYPIITITGSIIKKSMRAFFDIKSASVHGATTYNETKDVFGCVAVCQESCEVFSARSSAPNFLKYLIQETKGKEEEKQERINEEEKQEQTHTFSIKQILQLQQQHQQQTVEKDAQRYTKVEYQHINKKAYWKRDPSRTIVNTRHNNQLSMETNTTFQSQNEVRQSLANSSYYSSFDISQFYDQLAACPVSSLLNTVLYKGQEIAMTIASMGSRNSCLWATAVVLSLLHHHTDQLLLQPCYMPKPIQNLQMIQQRRQMTAEESYSMVAPTDLPACDLLMQVIHREETQERQESPKHIVELTMEQKKKLREGNQHQLIHQVTLIDDFCIATAQIPNTISTRDQEKKQLNIHILCLKQLFMSSIECSRQTSKSGKPFQPAKYKFEKTNLFKTSVKFLNYIYINNHQIINLEAYKGATNLDTLPMTGEALASRLSFFTYFINYIGNLRFLCKELEEIATKNPNNKQIPWDQNPDSKQKYEKLILAVRAISGIQVLPNDLNKINFLVTSSDACNKTTAYNVGINLRPDPQSKDDKQAQPTKLKLVKNHSSNLESNLLNLPISTKETMSAVRTLTQEEPLLKLLGNIKKFHTIDNSVLFGLLEQLMNSKQLANHFVAHPQFKEYVMRLHQLTTMYNITVLLVPSKQCLADVCTRSNKPKDKGTATCKQIRGRPTCEICPGCDHTCVNSTPHKDCPFNIRNTTKLAEHGPQLLQYDKTEEHTVENEGEIIRYTTAYTHFKPDEYKIFPIDKLVQEINVMEQKSHKTLDQNQTDDEAQANNEEIQRIENFTEEDMEREIQQIERASQPTTEPKILQIQPRGTNEEEKGHTEKKRYETMPDNLYRINIYSKQKWQPTKEDAERTTIIMFTNNRKSLRIASSLYAQQLVGTHTEKLEKRVNGVTYTENPGGLNYLIICTPQDKLQESNHPANVDSFVPQLRIVMKEAMIRSPDRKLVIDGNSIQKFYNLSADTIMTGIIIVTRTYRQFFQDIGLVMWYKNDKQSDGATEPLKLSLPIYQNGIRQGTISCILNNNGNCPELERKLKPYTWKARYNCIQIEDNRKRREQLTPRSDLTQAQAIHINQRSEQRQERRYIRTTNIEQRTEEGKQGTKFTLAVEQSAEPILDALLAKRKLIIAQANDPYLTPIQQQLQQAKKDNKILQSECGQVKLKLIDDIIYGKPANNHNKQAWKPCIPESMLITEIMLAHEAQRCSSTKNTVEQVEKVFYHKKNITSHYSLQEISTKVLPCPRCVVRRPTHKTGSKLYMQTKSIAMSLGGLPCATLAHDIVYITNPKNNEFVDKYLSLIVCYGCSYVHIKLINKIDGYQIATHLLDMIQVTGHVPHVLITDSATTELRGIVAQCIQSLSIIQLKTNKQILGKQRKEHIHHQQPRPENTTTDQEDPTIDPEEFPSVLLEDLTINQKNMLLQDFKDSAPPLYPPMLTHNPVPYIDKHSYRTTSLGRLDAICGEIGVFLRKFITTQPEQLEDENIDYLTQAYAFYHNFVYQDVRTKQHPAKMHLGILRFHNTHTLMKRIHQNPEKEEELPEPIDKLQNMITIAQEYQRAQENRVAHEQEQQRSHLHTHGRLMKEDKLETMFPVLSIVMLHNEINFTKTSKHPSLHGPHLVLAHVPNKRNMYIFSLVEGRVYKRSYRAIQNLLPSQELFSTPNISDWFHHHPLQLINKLSTIEKMDPQLTKEQYTNVLQNIAKVYELLNPVLPTVEETQKTISLETETIDQDRERDETEVTAETREHIGEKHDEATARKTVKFRTAEPIDMVEDITSKQKTTKTQTEPPRQQHQHQQQPGMDVRQTPTPQEIQPRTIQPTREQTRPKRERILPARYRNDQ